MGSSVGVFVLIMAKITSAQSVSFDDICGILSGGKPFLLLYLLDLWVFLLGLGAEIPEIILQRFEELLCLLCSGCATPHE